MKKRLTDFAFILASVILWLSGVTIAFGQTYKDSLVTVSQTHDTTFTKVVTESVTHDSSYIVKVLIPAPPVVLQGMYMNPAQCTIGDVLSENSFLFWCKREGVNMLNCYARSYLYTESKRTQLAAFVKKAKEQYGIGLVTVDVRLTNASEYPGWQAYFAKYAGTISIVEPLTEFEPYVKNSSGIYDYAGFFNLVRTMGALCKQYGVKFNFYEGWIGNNFFGENTFSQMPVDSMVKYVDRVFMSNYVTAEVYNSTDPTKGKCDSRMDKRLGYIAVSCPKFNKTIDVVEILSLERKVWGAANDFLGTIFSCPATTTNKCEPFYGVTYTQAVAAYELSTTAVKQYTNLIGRTIFQSSYGQYSHPK